jgi:catechol 2,3-dioxygenase-like lactoylglutathione lyase family enzyme
MRITGIDHVQLAMPAGQEEAAREFYARTLGIPEVPKPPDLARRGGAWFEDGAVKVHLGVEADFRPARKAHPAFIVQDLATLVATLRSKGHEIVPADGVPGIFRVHVADPFGNRLELIDSR